MLHTYNWVIIWAFASKWCECFPLDDHCICCAGTSQKNWQSCRKRRRRRFNRRKILGVYIIKWGSRLVMCGCCLFLVLCTQAQVRLVDVSMTLVSASMGGDCETFKLPLLLEQLIVTRTAGRPVVATGVFLSSTVSCCLYWRFHSAPPTPKKWWRKISVNSLPKLLQNLRVGLESCPPCWSVWYCRLPSPALPPLPALLPTAITPPPPPQHTHTTHLQQAAELLPHLHFQISTLQSCL